MRARPRPVLDPAQLPNKMPYRKIKFDNGDIIHVMLRGIDGSAIFRDIDDYYRGIFSIYEFNNSNPVSIQKRREGRSRFKQGRGQASTFADGVDVRDRFVDLLAFCFMPNHIHLLVKQIKEGGITNFISKIGTGLGGYINRKYKRRGHIFQSNFEAVKIETNEQLEVVFTYIHTNPISLIYKDWKIIKIGDTDWEKIIEFLNAYKWSSHSDYIGIKNFPSVITREFIINLFSDEKKYFDFIKDYILNKGQLGN